MDIFDLNPINKTAALVTSQSGCASDDTLTDEQKRENLVSAVKLLESKIIATPKGLKRKALNNEKAELCKKINLLRPKTKTPGIEKYVMDVLREDMSKFEFDRLLGRAAERMRAHKTHKSTSKNN